MILISSFGVINNYDIESAIETFGKMSVVAIVMFILFKLSEKYGKKEVVKTLILGILIGWGIKLSVPILWRIYYYIFGI